MSPFLLRVGSAVAILMFSVGCKAGGGMERTPLAEYIEEASKSFEGGRFPAFVEEPKTVGVIDIEGDARRCLTPPFPSRLSFDLEVPSSGFLKFSPAVVMEHDIRRARIEFIIDVEAGGQAERVYVEDFRSNRANQWYERRIDLTRWSGQTIQLTLEIRAIPARVNILWADRVQTVWGEPVLTSSPLSHIDAQMREVLVSFGDKLEEGAELSGVGPEQQLLTLRFAINLLVGGLLGMSIRELYKRYCSTRTNRAHFANMLPLFTIATTTVVFVVQHSPALSLGLIGALSIVRFRTAISTTEDLSYLLLAVTLGAVLGASHVLLAIVTVVVVTPFVILRPSLSTEAGTSNVMLTVTGPPEQFFTAEGSNVMDILKGMTSNLIVQRLDREADRVYCRAWARFENRERLIKLVSVLRERTTHCQISNLDGDTASQ